MKKIYLYAVALSSVFAGCSSDTLVEDNITTNPSIAYKAKTQSSLAELVTEISTGCNVKPLKKRLENRKKKKNRNVTFAA